MTSSGLTNYTAKNQNIAIYGTIETPMLFRLVKHGFKAVLCLSFTYTHE